MMNVAALAAVTPVTRDRYVDLLRVLSLGVVVLGHWLMAVVVVGADGSVRTTNLLAIEPALQSVTWLLQVMPVFFLVGGFSHATAVASLERRGGGYADFARSRAGRLLRPTAVFAGVWLVLALLVELLGEDRGILKLATRLVAQPLWFVGVYLGIVALAPAMLRLHRWSGRWAPAVPVAFGVAAGLVDVARFAYDVPYVAFLNLALVWLGVHQVGFLYADGLFRNRRLPLALLVTGLVGTVLCTTVGPYPTSMVGMPGEKVSNMSPPTFALVMCAVSLIGLTMLLRGPVTRWLDRPAVWRGVIAANGLAMTAFLWHLTAMFLATAVVMAAGIGLPAVGSGAWWLLRPVWIGVLAALTAGLVAVFRGADRPRPATVPAGNARPAAGSAGNAGPAAGSAGPAAGSDGHARPAVVAGGRGNGFAIGGMVLCTFGVLGFSAVGFGGLLAGRTATLIVLPVTPLTSALLVAGGAVLLRLSRR